MTTQRKLTAPTPPNHVRVTIPVYVTPAGIVVANFRQREERIDDWTRPMGAWRLTYVMADVPLPEAAATVIGRVVR